MTYNFHGIAALKTRDYFLDMSKDREAQSHFPAPEQSTGVFDPANVVSPFEIPERLGPRFPEPLEERTLRATTFGLRLPFKRGSHDDESIFTEKDEERARATRAKYGFRHALYKPERAHFAFEEIEPTDEFVTSPAEDPRSPDEISDPFQTALTTEDCPGLRLAPIEDIVAEEPLIFSQGSEEEALIEKELLDDSQNTTPPRWDNESLSQGFIDPENFNVKRWTAEDDYSEDSRP